MTNALLARATNDSTSESRRPPRCRLYGCELLTAPWGVATLRLARSRAALRAAYPESPSIAAGSILLGSALAPIRLPPSSTLVVLGNPPWSGHSANPGAWIDALMRGPDPDTGCPVEDYFSINGHPLQERNLKWLNDDYVKFMRLGQWRIEQAGSGILAFITNHGYIENPTFRAMRHSLMCSFDALYIIDMHGNSKKREHARDQNLFEIRQGAAIGLFVRFPRTSTTAPRRAIVRHVDLWGRRAEGDDGGKLGWLEHHTIETTSWKIIQPTTPHFLFRPFDQDIISEYESGWAINAIFSLGSIGIATSRDRLAVGFSAEELEKRIEAFLDPTLSDQIAREHYLGPRDKLQIERVRVALRADSEWRRSITSCLYRPFDRRALLYHPLILERARTRVMAQMRPSRKGFSQNLGMIVCRGKEIGREWEHVFCSKEIIQLHSASLKEGNYLFPLYSFFQDVNGDTERRPNFCSEFTEYLPLLFDGYSPEPEEVFYYLYAVLHAPSYRARYADPLKSDFPRVPFARHRSLFLSLAEHGKRLVSLHLGEVIAASNVAFHTEAGNMTIEFVVFLPGVDNGETDQIRINKQAFFSGIPIAAWNGYIGGYHIASRWLKDRIGRNLTSQDVETYRALIGALTESASIMTIIDQNIDQNGGWPDAFQRKEENKRK
ncbi:hypothetical protein CCP2SC5_190001 [Azospirillaceae bacterium]